MSSKMERFRGADQSSNPGAKHDFHVTRSGTPFCLACGSVRSASGSTDKSPCRGVVKVVLR